MSKGLGRGLDSLIPTSIADVSDFTVTNEDRSRVQQVAVSQLHPDPTQPRKVFDEGELHELASSIKEHGIIQPLIVTRHKDSFMIVAGERRWRAAQLIGLKDVPVIVRTTDELQRLELALVENVQREDLRPLDMAGALARLQQEFNLDSDAIARKVGKATTTVINTMRLLQLPEEAMNALQEGKITEGHARSILALKGDEKKQHELLDYIQRFDWSVRKAEQFVTAYKQGVTSTRMAARQTATQNNMTRALTKQLGAKVFVQPMAKGKGRLVVEYKDQADLERITKQLGI